MTIRQQLDYSDNARKLLYGTLRDHPDVFGRPFETLAEFKSIRALVAHIAGAEERWIVERIGGGSLPAQFEQRAPETVDGVFHDWEGIRAKTHALIATLDTTGLGGMIPVRLPRWGYDGKMTVEQILFHVFNHQTFHLGQVSMALQMFGVDPPNFDFVFLRSDG